MPLVLVCLGLLAGAYGLGLALCSATGLPAALAAHAALMITAWGVMMPAGAIVARYFKVTPRQNFPAELDNPFWWRWHRVLQYGAVALSTTGLVVVLSATGGRFDTLHGRLGLVAMTLAWLQVASAAMRGAKGGPTDRRADPREPTTWRGDHYDMSRRRLLFEGWHKRAGWVAVALAGITILLGIDLAGAPVWLVLLVAGMQGGAVLVTIDSALRGRWVDTYAALWGPDPVHPGNRCNAALNRRVLRRHHARSSDGSQGMPNEEGALQDKQTMLR